MRKNKRVFVDTDIILDLLCNRDVFYAPAAELFTLAENARVTLYTSALSFANIFYILRKILGNTAAKNVLRKLKLLVTVLPVHAKVIDLALNSSFRDFEDAIQYFTARTENISTLITRNVRDYKIKDMAVQTAAEYVKIDESTGIR